MAYATTYVTPGTQYDQVFTYTCTGLESNPFSIPLPAARAAFACRPPRTK